MKPDSDHSKPAPDSQNTSTLPWESKSASFSLDLLTNAYKSGRPVVLLLGAGLSVDSGIPLAGQLSQYLVHVAAMVRNRNFTSARQYLEETMWPGRHDLRVELMLELEQRSLHEAMKEEERVVSQAAVVSELRHASPTLAYGLDEVFGQIRPQWNQASLQAEFSELLPIARGLAKRVPRNVAYRSLLFHLCDRSQALIDGCLDHFIRDRSPTTTHQLIVFVTQLLRSRVVLSTNFDSLLERAFAFEGIVPRVYEIQGEGTLPSARMLLSLQFPIVKLHGGAHQMRTGFDLDDPLSPAVLASFYEFFDRLTEQTREKPLMVVLGYSGSDRRVMDIVHTHIKRWRPEDERPCVLWLNRDPWVPDLLKSAVNTHPHVLYGMLTPNSQPTKLANIYNKYPAHIVGYSDGRLFLLEAYQRLAGEFPIGKSYYQAVSFVPHEAATGYNAKDLSHLLSSTNLWRIALIRSRSGGGSSSHLAALAKELDSSYRTIWIDLAEVPGISALMDIISEHLMKYDHRLQALRRPLLLESMLYDRIVNVSGASISVDVDFDVTDPDKIVEAELTLAIRWLQHALRRGQYLLALDSLDEFPGSHPASQTQGTSFAINGHHALNQACVVKCFLERLMSTPENLGDSRVAIALNVDNRPLEAISKLRHSQIEEPSDYFFLALEAFRRAAGDTTGVALLELRGDSTATIPNDQELFKKWKSLLNASDTDAALILAVAACGRRIRTEVSLGKVAAAIHQDLEKIGQKYPDLDDDKILPLISQESDAASDRSKGSKGTHKAQRQMQEALNRLWIDELRSDETNALWLATATADHPALQWFYRLEGGYHWMHHDIRDRLYLSLSNAYPAHVCLLHHRLAEFCHHDLYDRSRDTRAFLEYIFHRSAAISLLCNKAAKAESGPRKQMATMALDWLRRLVRALSREKGTLLARARLPSLVFQLRQTVFSLSRDFNAITGFENISQVRDLLSTILGVIGELLLAAGHPHSALECNIARLWLLLDTATELPVLIDLSDERYQLTSLLSSKEKVSTEGLNDDIAKKLAARLWFWPPGQEGTKIPGAVVATSVLDVVGALADVENAIMNPLMFTNSPTLSKDWPALMRSDLARTDRATRIGACEAILVGLSGYCDWARSIVRIRDDFQSRAIDLARTVTKRRLEFELVKNSAMTPLIATSRLYSGDKDAESVKQEAGVKTAEDGGTSDVVNMPVGSWMTQDLSNEDEMHAWRVTAKGPRHECYRLCLQARRLALSPSCTKDEWARIEGLFGDAEAVLARSGDPADTQALAITRLTFAEHCLRRAERLTLQSVDKLKGKRPSIRTLRIEISQKLKEAAEDKEAAENFATSVFLHSKAVQLLLSINDIFNDGRGELTWRFYYLLTQARARLFQAFLSADDTPVKAMEEIEWAARFLVSALSNCGICTDRRMVLVTWWAALRTCMRELIGDEQKFLQHWARVKAVCGVDWNINWRTASNV